MRLYTQEAKRIYRLLKDKYPLKGQLPSIRSIVGLDDIICLELSHFDINGLFDYNYDMCVNLKNITHIQTATDTYTLQEYLRFATRYIRGIERIRLIQHPDLFPVSPLPILHIQKVCSKNNWSTPTYVHLAIEKAIRSPFANHFFFEDFNINEAHANLSREINRLIEVRDRYTTLHFHLEKGGDLVPVHVILRCLCGKPESWMKPYSILDSVWGNIQKDPWSPWDTDSVDYRQYLELGIKQIPCYDTKYKGTIVIHANNQCASSAWFCITYLIYAFANSIERSTQRINGVSIKVGRLQGPSLKLIGHSLTTSGDGNSQVAPITIANKMYKVQIPTQQFIESPVKVYDYNRFWLPT
jgi:hypothetical protein